MAAKTTRELILQYLSLIALIMLAFSYFSFASDTAPEPYPHLNSWGDKPAKCGLKPEEAKWLEEQINAGSLRVATLEDIKAWEDLAKAKGRRINKIKLDCGRTFVVLQALAIPEEIIDDVPFSGWIVFLTSPKAPYPQVNSGSPVYDMKTGGWFMLGKYDDGTSEGMAQRYPRYDESIYGK